MYNSNGLTMQQLQTLVPSAFATHAADDRSARYGFVPTAQIIERLDKEGFYPVRAQQTRCKNEDNRAFTKHVIRFRVRQDNAISRQVGDVYPEVVLTNSHDGTSSYEVSAGLFRLACLNGMTVPYGNLGSGIRVRHQGDIAGDVIDATYSIVETLPEILDKSKAWQGLLLTDSQQMSYARAAATLRWDSEEETPMKDVAILLAPRRVEDWAADLWHTYNRVQENLTKGGADMAKWQKRRTMKEENGRQKSFRGISSVHEDIRLNRALWTLTEELGKHVNVMA